VCVDGPEDGAETYAMDNLEGLLAVGVVVEVVGENVECGGGVQVLLEVLKGLCELLGDVVSQARILGGACWVMACCDVARTVGFGGWGGGGECRQGKKRYR
jgi:hypothetical protein